MSREVRRVVENFDWELNEVWLGFIKPEWLRSRPCTACDYGHGALGYSAIGNRYYEQWYGYGPFDPRDNGSEPLTAKTPAVEAFARRNVAQAPDYYGTGEAAVEREGERLAKLWNGMWLHHLSEADVTALLEADALVDLTHEWRADDGWVKREGIPAPTAEVVNNYSISSFSSISPWAAWSARAEREGAELLCTTCSGNGAMEAWAGQTAAADAWEPLQPPAGDWWQVWESVSEGSPVSPAFETAEELAEYLSAHSDILGPSSHRLSKAEALNWVQGAGWIPSAMTQDGKLLAGAELIAED